MGSRKRQGLRHTEVVAALRLVMECGELWYDPEAWRTHLTHGLWDLTRAGVVGNEVYRFSEAHPEGELRSLAVGGEPDGHAPDGLRKAWSCSSMDKGLPARVYEYGFRSLSTHGHAQLVPYDLVGKRGWQSSRFFERFLEPFGLVEGVASMRPLRQPGHTSSLSITRTKQQPRVQPWQRDLLELVHSALAPLLGTRLAIEGQLSTAGLSPRRRQVLDLLLEGASEKEAAHQLQIARPTVHQYVGDLYRWFGVSSRAELMAYFIRRRPLDRSAESSCAR